MRIRRGFLTALVVLLAAGRVAAAPPQSAARRTALPDYRDVQCRQGLLFALLREPRRRQPALVTLRSWSDPRPARPIVDPNVLNPAGTTAIDFFVPSLNGRKVAVSLSEKGSEDGTVHIYDVTTGRALPDVIPRVNGGTAGGSLAWNADGTGFYYTRYPRGKERPPEDLDFYQQIYFHKLGTPPEQDVYSLGNEFPRIAAIALQTSGDGAFVLASVAHGRGGAR